MHAFDYANVVNFWLRNFTHVHQRKAVYLSAWFVTDPPPFRELVGCGGWRHQKGPGTVCSPAHLSSQTSSIRPQL